MDNNCINKGVVCQVTDCYYHTAANECKAEKIEVCNCNNCSGKSKDTFCSTYREKNI